MAESRIDVRPVRRMVQFLPAAHDAQHDTSRCRRIGDGEVEFGAVASGIGPDRSGWLISGDQTKKPAGANCRPSNPKATRYDASRPIRMVSRSACAVNTPKGYLMPTKEWSFWRDEAKLSILDTEAHLKFALWVSGGILTFIIPFALGISAFKWEGPRSLFVSLCAIGVVWPIALVIDMWPKGRNAGKRLKDQIAANNSESDRRRVSKILTETKHELSRILDQGRTAYPGSSGEPTGAAVLSQRIVEFANNLQTRTTDCIRSCDERTTGIPEASLGIEEFAKPMSHHQVMEQIDIKSKLIDTILTTLWPHGGP
jgi:hypothetical protein